MGLYKIQTFGDPANNFGTRLWFVHLEIATLLCYYLVLPKKKEIHHAFTETTWKTSWSLVEKDYLEHIFYNAQVLVYVRHCKVLEKPFMTQN